MNHGQSQLPTVNLVRERSAEIRQRLNEASGGRRVTLVAVTKGFGPEIVPIALGAGLVDLGENYAQELEHKVAQLGADSTMSQNLGGETGPRWHFIGGLQRNKIRRLGSLVDLWHTIDRTSLLDELAKRSRGASVLIQVNTTDEPQKSGCKPDEVGPLVDYGRQLGLEVNGLMTIGPTGSSIDPRPGFELLTVLGQRYEVSELSMGMSNDYEMAAASGATIVRIGSALFGPRSSVR